MGVNPCYKHTEVGVIPKDWDVTDLGRICTQVTTGKLDANEMTSDGQYRFYTCAREYYQIDTYAFDTEALLISGNGANVGYIHHYKGKFNAYQRTYVLSGFLESIKYVQHYMNQMLTRRISVEVNAGNTPYITRGTLTEMEVALPPTKAEQEAIAEALSDADSLIESLERLLAKKRQIKQGAMQELLTGKKRLPGFSGEWVVKTIEDVTDCLDNLRVPLNEGQRDKMRGDYPYCGANGVLDFVNDYLIDDDIILIAEDGGYFDEYAYRPIASRMVERCWVNNHAHILKSKAGYDQGFIFYSLVHKNILSFLASGTRAKLNKSEMSKIEISMPPDEIEQTAIASILSDIDSEIAALEAKIGKAKKVKQGMMQKLLTGRIRLV
jgi:type I restriction enzyme, S subunit